MTWARYDCKYYRAYTQEELIEFEILDIHERSLDYWNFPGKEGLTPPKNCDKNFKAYRKQQVKKSDAA